MTADENRLIEICRAAGQKNDWGTVYGCARELVSRHPSNPEGFFFLGMAEKAAQRTAASVDAFEKCLQLDGNRFDAGMELASQYAKSFRNDEALALLQRYSNSISQSPWYLDMAGTIYTGMGKAAAATPMFERAASLQSDALFFQSHLAANYVFVGKIDAAKDIYRSLLATNPNHQRNHYSLSRLERAVNRDHVNQMKAVLQRENKPESQNVFLYYALGKELEDLESWDEAMDFYLKGARAVKSVLNYRVADDEALIQQIIDSCSTDWYQEKMRSVDSGAYHKKPIFLVGLPRTGTTLAERILSGHSKIESIGETHYFEMVMKTTSGLAPSAKMTPQVILSAIDADAGGLGQRYLDRVRYLWGDKELFIEKLPKNHLYLGFIAAAFPDAPIVWLRRNPMDACLAMFKQLFTGVYEFTYDFDDLARYYRMYDRLYAHWKAVLGDRIIEIEYENLVSDLPGETANVLARMGLGYEQACIEFDENTAPSTTASAVQVREKVHSKSVLKWKNFARHLEPLRSRLEADGIVT
jgi:tetratricopeptide (TPR) repeat protein